MGTMIDIAALDGSGAFKAYRATPTDKPKGAIVVIQEIFGINPGIRAKVESWAAKGYAAYALDLFWRDTPGVQLDPDIPEEFQRGLEHMKKVDIDKAVEDIEATIRAARSETGVKVGVSGYCFGGLLTFLAATRTDSDASVGYYGGGINNYLGESHGISRPLMLHFAEKDHFIPAEVRAEIETALKDNSRVEIHSYPDVDHGFATEFGKRRNDAAATQADQRTQDFFAKHLA
jgi:carboxymethylenebutenolidase